MNYSKELSVLSELVYEDWYIVLRRLTDLGYSLRHVFDHHGTQAILVENSQFAALVFRGTEATKLRLRDIFSNIGRPIRWSGRGLIHNGYARHFEKVRYEARKMAEKISEDKPLYVTGHSMGGALATIYASWVNHNLAGLITFGAPKALDSKATAAIDAPATVYQNRFDFAPYWPPSLKLTNPKPHKAVDSGGWFGPISRHMAGKYIKALKN